MLRCRVTIVGALGQYEVDEDSLEMGQIISIVKEINEIGSAFETQLKQHSGNYSNLGS